MSKRPTENVPPPELRPKEPPGDVPDIGGEFTTEGVDKDDWKEGHDPFPTSRISDIREELL